MSRGDPLQTEIMPNLAVLGTDFLTMLVLSNHIQRLAKQFSPLD
jgi:hypothetical protein